MHVLLIRSLFGELFFADIARDVIELRVHSRVFFETIRGFVAFLADLALVRSLPSVRAHVVHKDSLIAKPFKAYFAHVRFLLGMPIFNMLRQLHRYGKFIRAQVTRKALLFRMDASMGFQTIGISKFFLADIALIHVENAMFVLMRFKCTGGGETFLADPTSKALDFDMRVFVRSKFAVSLELHVAYAALKLFFPSMQSHMKIQPAVVRELFMADFTFMRRLLFVRSMRAHVPMKPRRRVKTFMADITFVH